MMKQVYEVYELLDSPSASGAEVKAYLEQLGQAEITVSTVEGDKGSTDFIKIVIAGKNGRIQGGNSPTLGVVGRLGGLGARPEMIGFVS
ncbi:DUF1177 family protein, partial [Paenibacillus sp. Aloe-11]|uniref:DUF1177 family protein n=1 Tax=Paenibacillus sp. Aloe-11 TaxID=1050222 RepID=UPI00024EFB4A